MNVKDILSEAESISKEKDLSIDLNKADEETETNRSYVLILEHRSHNGHLDSKHFLNGKAYLDMIRARSKSVDTSCGYWDKFFISTAPLNYS